jgi:ABC-type Fe3+-siderophore transport system permease subunit
VKALELRRTIAVAAVTVQLARNARTATMRVLLAATRTRWMLGTVIALLEAGAVSHLASVAVSSVGKGSRKSWTNVLQRSVQS